MAEPMQAVEMISVEALWCTAATGIPLPELYNILLLGGKAKFTF